MWTDLKVDKNYEIFTEEPHTIRNKRTLKILKGWKKAKGYIGIQLSGINYQLHRVLAIQFIPNDNPELDQVDHKNGDPADNRIENLQWTNNSGNNRNRNGYRGAYEIFEELPPFVRKITNYQGKTVDDSYYIDDFYNIYYDNGTRIRLLRQYTDKTHKYPRVLIRINNKDVRAGINNL